MSHGTWSLYDFTVFHSGPLRHPHPRTHSHWSRKCSSFSEWQIKFRYAIVTVWQQPPTKLQDEREKNLIFMLFFVLSFFWCCLCEGVKEILSLAKVVAVASFSALCVECSSGSKRWLKSHFQVNNNISCHYCCCCCCCGLSSVFYSLTLNSLSCCFSLCIVFLPVSW